MKRAALYSRVSTIHHGQSVDMQLHDLRKLAEQRGFQIVKEYSDQGVSGSKSSRPALDAMLVDAKRGKFHILLTWRLDRLGRSTAHLINMLDDLKNSGVELISFSEGLDFSTASGKLFYTLISAFAEFEKNVIGERVRAGLRNARSKGTRLGRPQLAADASKIAALRAQGASSRTISDTLAISTRTARRAVQRLVA
jgi:DNA invertase Pin-like site-specific DNA recombinase